jgi:hypothetical protein
MKTLYNTKLSITNLTWEQYTMLIDFIEEHKINYDETDFEEFTLDTRSDIEKYDDWLSEQADLHNDDVKMGII